MIDVLGARLENESMVTPVFATLILKISLALYRPGLLSAERIILTDALEEATLRLEIVESSQPMDHLVYNGVTDRLGYIRSGMAQFIRFVKDNFLLIQVVLISKA